MGTLRHFIVARVHAVVPPFWTDVTGSEEVVPQRITGAAGGKRADALELVNPHISLAEWGMVTAGLKEAGLV